jgi:hypothetical protein
MIELQRFPREYGSKKRLGLFRISVASGRAFVEGELADNNRILNRVTDLRREEMAGLQDRNIDERLPPLKRVCEV